MKRVRLLLFSVLSLFAVSCFQKLPQEVEVTSVSLSQPNAEMLEGETVQLIATVLPSDATDKTVTWASSKQSVATVSTSGLVTAVSVGESTITASAGGKSATCHVTVSKKKVEVTSVSLDKTALTLEEGQSTTLIASVSPSNATDQTVAWSSSIPSVATVSDAGVVTAVSEGEAAITATAGGKSATCVVTVVKKTIEVTSVSLDRTTLSMEIGQTTMLVATVSPADATDKTVKWTSSSPSVASVDDNGVVSALQEGSTAITASAGGKSAVCLVTVAKKVVPVSSVTLDRTSVTLEIGASTTLVATVSPADATDKTVSWTNSDDSVISLDGNGKITALKEGTATVTAIAGDKSASCAVTVAKSVIPVTSITLDQTSLTLQKGESTKLTATVSPSDATDKTVSWSSSDMTVVKVDQDGTVHALKGGTATVYAKAGEQSATCRVTVVSPVTGVTLDRESLTLVVGETTTLVATVHPDDATEKTVTWTSSDSSVASVDGSGKVTALKKGSATVTATAGGKSATCTVTVNNVPFAISPTEVVLPGSGGRFEVTVTCSSSYHINSTPDWVVEKTVDGKKHTFEVAVNPESESRSGVVVFCDDEGTCLPCKVTQAAGGNFAISPVSVEMDAGGGEFVVTVACSTGYHINSQPAWISEVTSPSQVQEHVFKVSANSSEDDRSGVIVFCDDKGTCLPCTVKQKGREPDSAGGGNEDVSDGDPVKW